MSDPADKSEGESQNNEGPNQGGASPRTWRKPPAWLLSVRTAYVFGVSYLVIALIHDGCSLEPFANIALAGSGLVCGFLVWRHQKWLEARAEFGADLLSYTHQFEFALERLRIAIGDSAKLEDRDKRRRLAFADASANWLSSLDRLEVRFDFLKASEDSSLKRITKIICEHINLTREDLFFYGQDKVPDGLAEDAWNERRQDAEKRLAAKFEFPEGRIEGRYLNDKHSKVLAADFATLKRVLEDWTSFR